MITATPQRRGRNFFWALAASTAIMTVVAALIPSHLLVFIQGAPEVFSRTETVSIERSTPVPPAPVATSVPTVQPKSVATPVPAAAAEPAPAVHELAKEALHAPPQPPQRPHAKVDALARDRTAFDREVAQLNAQNDPHAIPTIDPATQASASKSYSLELPNGERGNGEIFPTHEWHERGLDCYYGRYEYTYPDGSQEAAAIAWPFCFPPAADPFHRASHLMPMPFPMPGYVLPAGTQLPPLEKQVYEDWIGSQ